MTALKTNKLHGLDHLRALAIILVLLYHYCKLFPHPLWIESWGSFGWIGVDLFFVLSGYLIASQLLEGIKESNTVNLKEFYVKRFFRIIPAYLTVVFLYFAVPVFKEREGLAPLWKFLSFTQNLGLDLKTQRAFSHAWSLCIEEQFYLLFPLALFGLTFIRRRKIMVWGLLILFIGTGLLRLLSWQIWMVPLEGDPLFGLSWTKYIYYPTYNRLDALLAGVGLAAISKFLPRTKEFFDRNYLLTLVGGLILLTVSYFICKEQNSFNASIFGFSLVALSFGMITAAALSPKCFLYKFTSRITWMIALLSYSTYLLHKAMIHLTQDFCSEQGIDPGSTSVFWLSMGVTFTAAGALYLVIERPFMKLRTVILRRATPALVAKNVLPLLFVLIAGSSAAQNTITLTQKQKAEVVEDVCRLLNENYVFPDTAKKYTAYLKKQFKDGAYKKAIDPNVFSDLINRDLNSVHKDGHLQTQFNPAFAAQLLAPEQVSTTTEDPFKRIRAANFGLTKVEILNGNIGYLNISKFWADDVYGKETVKAALKFLSNSNAIIIDLRNCGGGSPKTVSLICGYFLKEKTHLNDSYDRAANFTTEYWTTPDTTFKALFDIPLYVLTSSGTFSASEEFCYDLQALKRAKIVGEKTGGGAHNTFEQPVKHGFVIYIPYGRAINPVTKTNWEGTGVTPDLTCLASKALETAEMDVFKTLMNTTKSEKEKFDLNWQYELLRAINNPIVIDTATLKRYAGNYGERVFTYENGKLFYQRTGKPKFELEPMTKTVMRGKGNEYFKIEFVETNGEVNEVKAYYQDNRVESSRRDGK